MNMQMLILNAGKQSELATLNASGPQNRDLSALPLVDGGAALPAALLTDCGPGQTWEYYSAFLQTLPCVEIAPNQIVEPAIV